MPNMHRRGRDRHFEHDNRDRQHPNPDMGGNRRVSFKGHRDGRVKINRQSGWDNKVRHLLLDDEDVDMNNAGGSGRSVSISRYAPYVGGRGGGFRGRGGMKYARASPPVPTRRYLQESLQAWYKIILPFGGKFEKEYILKVLTGYIRPQTFIPYGYKRGESEVSFFVDEHSIAEQLLMADRRITTPDGHKMRINVRHNMSFFEVDDELKEKIKVVMSKRYQVATKALDLRKFHADPDFVANDLLVPLNKTNVMQAVIQIICQMVPELLALDLSENKIGVLDQLKPLVDKVSSLKVLHLANNRIRHINIFEAIHGLSLEDLMIDGNPVCDKFKDHTIYVREVRRRFPKVIKLDGIDLPPPITFDVEDDTKIVPSKGSFLCDVAGGEVARQFIEQYYTIYDSGSRQPLIDAYHQHAQFSLTCTSGLPNYTESRNLLLVTHLDKRQRLLRQGRGNITAYLTTLAKTQHDPASFAVDLTLFTPQLISLSIAGVFREVNGTSNNKKVPMRSFNRTFIIVPAGSGFAIVNDLLFITNVTQEQAREAFKMPVIAPQPPPPAVPVAPSLVSSPVMPSAVSTLPPGPSSMVPDQNLAAQQQMIATLAMQSGMNLMWSEKCLIETNWDFERALFVFNELNKTGSIPAAAFIK